jgi:hypothetical protein
MVERRREAAPARTVTAKIEPTEPGDPRDLDEFCPMANHEPQYEPLSRYLHGVTHPVCMSFAEISRLVGGLPPSVSRR